MVGNIAGGYSVHGDYMVDQPVGNSSLIYFSSRNAASRLCLDRQCLRSAFIPRKTAGVPADADPAGKENSFITSSSFWK